MELIMPARKLDYQYQRTQKHTKMLTYFPSSVKYMEDLLDISNVATISINVIP